MGWTRPDPYLLYFQARAGEARDEWNQLSIPLERPADACHHSHQTGLIEERWACSTLCVHACEYTSGFSFLHGLGSQQHGPARTSTLPNRVERPNLSRASIPADPFSELKNAAKRP